MGLKNLSKTSRSVARNRVLFNLSQRTPGLRFCSAVAISLLIAAALHTMVLAAAAPITMRVGYPQPSGAQLPLWVMSEAQLDRKYGVDLQNIYISGGARLTQTLVAGDIDMATTGGAVINAVLSGAELVYVALIVPTYGFSVYARPDVKDISSLKGKVVGVMTKGASSDHGMIAVLRHNHLNPGQDVKFLYLGGVREALAALERGIVSASVLSAPTTLMARRLGFKEVVNIASLNLLTYTMDWSPAVRSLASSPKGSKPSCAATSPPLR